MEPEFISVDLDKSYRLINHGPIKIFSTWDGKNHNAAPINWTMPIGFKPALFIAVITKNTKTASNILKNGEAVINIPTVRERDLITQLGNKSGHKTEKLEPVRFTKSTKLSANRLVDCVAWIEVKLKSVLSAEHELYLFEAVASFMRKDAALEPGVVDITKFPTIHHMGSGNYLFASEFCK